MANASPTSSTRAPFGWVDLGMLLVISIWGLNFTVVKYALREMQPHAFNALRFVFATSLMFLLAWWSHNWKPVARRDWGLILLAGLIGNGLHQLLFMQGVALTLAGNASLLIASSPIFIALVGAAIGMETITRRMWVGIVSSFFGIGLVIAASGQGLSLSSSTFLGDLITLLAALAWVIYALVSRGLLERYSPIQLNALTMLASTPLLVAVGAPQLATQNWAAVTWRGWSGFVFSFAFSLCLSYIIYYYALRFVGNARANAYINLSPAITLIASALLLDERIGPWQIIGAAIILSGIYLTRSGSLRRTSATLPIRRTS